MSKGMGGNFKRTITALILVLLLNNVAFARGNGDKPVITSEDSVLSIKSLQNDIKTILANNSLDKTDIGIAVYSLDNNKYYYKQNIDKYFTPASVTKLFTTFSALYEFGPEYPVKTSIYANGSIKDGVFTGDLFLIGHGDALLSTQDIEKMVQQIAAKGIKEIKGNIHGDGSYFDDETSRFKYSGDDDVVLSIPPVTALSIEKNEVTVDISAGTKRGRKVQAELIPPSDAFDLKISAEVALNEEQSQPDNKAAMPARQVRYGDELCLLEPSSNRYKLSISSKVIDHGRQQFYVTGRMAPGGNQSQSFHIINPELAAAGTLKNRLEAAGIKVTGNIGSEKTPGKDTLTLLAEFSRPLINIITQLNKNSDNYMAETVFKMIGAHAALSKVTAESARQRIKEILDTFDIPCEECRLNDGSGLSRRNLVMPQSVIKLLTLAFRMDNRFNLDTTLSIAGVDGTLSKRFNSTLAENNLIAKTGTLRNVSALAGYVHTLDGEKIVFSFFFNGNNVGHYKRAENRLGKTLSRFFFFNDLK